VTSVTSSITSFFMQQETDYTQRILEVKLNLVMTACYLYGDLMSVYGSSIALTLQWRHSDVKWRRDLDYEVIDTTHRVAYESAAFWTYITVLLAIFSTRARVRVDVTLTQRHMPMWRHSRLVESKNYDDKCSLQDVIQHRIPCRIKRTL
jgi:hypothetical protein